MSKKNSGINDRDQNDGEQSHTDGNSGIDNRVDGDELSDPPDTYLPSEEEKKIAWMPDKRKADIV